MNQIFSRRNTRQIEFPLKLFGRLEQTEPSLNVRDGDDAVFAFDCVDAHWSRFGKNEMLDLNKSEILQSTMLAYWRPLFQGQDRDEGFYNDMPIYRLEVTVSKDDALYKYIVERDEPELDWLSFTLSKTTNGTQCDLFAYISAEPLEIFLEEWSPSTTQESKGLNAVYSVQSWPTTDIPALQQVVAKGLEHV